MAYVFVGLGILYFAGHALRWVFLRTRIPDLLLLMLVGFFMGPVTHAVKVEDFGQIGRVISLVALIVILYEGGLTLKARELIQSSLPALGFTLLSFATSACLATVLAKLTLFEDWGSAALFGLACGCTSATVVIPLVRQLSLSERMKTILSLESAFTDVLGIVLVLAVLEALTAGSSSAGLIASRLVIGPLLSIFLGSGLALGWSWLCKAFPVAIKRPFAGEAAALLVYGMVELMEFNGALAVLAMGFMLANQDLLPLFLRRKVDPEAVTHEDRFLLEQISMLLRSFFFIFLGISIRIHDMSVLWVALAMAALIIITRYLTIRLVAHGGNYSKFDRRMALFMGPRGLACAVLATLLLQNGWPSGEIIQNAVFAVIPVTILVTAVAVPWLERTAGPETRLPT